MGKSHLKTVAGGGLLDRRSFLMSGFALTAATGAHAASKSGDRTIGEDLPIWMTALGEHDEGYGKPAYHEEQVQRTTQKKPDQTAKFASWHTPLQSLRGAITPNGLHFTVHHNGLPIIEPDEHALIIHGMVGRPLKFEMESLLRYPMESRIRFLECSGNSAVNAASPFAVDASVQDLSGEVSGAEWTGVPLRLLLNEAGLKDGAKWVIAEGADSGAHARSIPLSKLMDDAIVALYQNGERIRASQGYPMRLFLPGWEGNANVKWLHRLEVTDVPAYTKDESGMYTEILVDKKIERFTFPMEVKSLITHPSGTQLLPEKKGFYEISGIAWSGHGKIRKVEVSADGGASWAEALLQGPPLDKALTRFTIPWQWDGSSATLLSRATDEYGRVQPARKEWKTRYAPHSYNHYNAIQAWAVNAEGRVKNVYS